MNVNAGVIRYAYDSALYYLTPGQKRKAVLMFFLLVFSSLLEAFGLASLVPVIMVASEPDGIHKNKYFQLLYDSLHFQSDQSFLIFLIAAIFVFFLFKNAFGSWVLYLQARFTSSIGLNVVASQADKYMNFPLANFQDLNSAKFVYSTIQVTFNYVNYILRPLFSFFSEVIMILIIVLGILLYEPQLVVVLVLVMGPSAWLTYRALRSRTQYIGSQVNQRKPVSIAILNNLYSGFIELKLAHKQQRLRNQLLANQDVIQQLEAESYLYSLMPLKIIEMVAILGLLTIFLYAILVTGSTESIVALLGLFVAAAYRLMPSINRMLTALVNMKQFSSSIDDLSAFREAQYDASLPATQHPLSFRREIVLDNLSFTFPGAARPTLDRISFRINKGDIIGFVGSSGSGKTTLMNVLLRFYLEQQGALRVDDQVLTPEHIRAWHQLIGYVKQDTFLMEASIRDNITLQDEQVDEARLWDAVEKASLAGFVQSLPEGLNTVIGERGSKLSGGQRQRIGIARALYKQAEILVLDEATSALDNETEREVNEAIHNLARTQITILIVAHRLTTLRECTRILELDQGRLVASYDYEELMRKSVH
ncbi:ABC transporter ATP-binding protein [Hymenobacter sp. B81]|uniref:ABC transporter ATP-binding protein n=1 Tax=Hymenobacter sp. B81 TaxID=3344878 RepID=UPI0037DDD356